MKSVRYIYSGACCSSTWIVLFALKLNRMQTWFEQISGCKKNGKNKT